MGFPHEDLAALIQALPEVADHEMAVYVNWPSLVDAPCVNVRPTRRTHKPGCRVEWELAIDVVSPLTADQAFIHPIVEAINEDKALKGFVVGDTEYVQRSLGGADLLFATTTVTHTR